MNTETINLTQVNVNAKNPRKISDPQLQRLVKSLLVFPEMLQLRPIVVDETNTALGGNMRYRALTAITTMSADEIRATFGCSDGIALCAATAQRRKTWHGSWAESWRTAW